MEQGICRGLYGGKVRKSELLQGNLTYHYTTGQCDPPILRLEKSVGIRHPARQERNLTQGLGREQGETRSKNSCCPPVACGTMISCEQKTAQPPSCLGLPPGLPGGWRSFLRELGCPKALRHHPFSLRQPEPVGSDFLKDLRGGRGLPARDREVPASRAAHHAGKRFCGGRLRVCRRGHRNGPETE